MTDPTPAVGGLSTEERGGLLIALDCAVEGGTLTHDAAMRVLDIVDNHPAAEREVEGFKRWAARLAADRGDALLRAEAADRELARVTAAVEALLNEVVDPIHAGGCNYRHQQGETDECNSCAAHKVETAVRAALSSADTGALDDLLDRERAKAAAEALREAADRGRKFLGDTDGSICWDWLADRAAAVSPEDGGA